MSRRLDQFHAAQEKETARIVNAFELAGYSWPDGRPRTAQKLYDAMCAIRGISTSTHSGMESQWAALRRWLAEIQCKAAPRAPAVFKPYVMPSGLRDAIARCYESAGHRSSSQAGFE